MAVSKPVWAMDGRPEDSAFPARMELRPVNSPEGGAPKEASVPVRTAAPAKCTAWRVMSSGCLADCHHATGDSGAGSRRGGDHRGRCGDRDPVAHAGSAETGAGGSGCPRAGEARARAGPAGGGSRVGGRKRPGVLSRRGGGAPAGLEWPTQQTQEVLLLEIPRYVCKQRSGRWHLKTSLTRQSLVRDSPDPQWRPRLEEPPPVVVGSVPVLRDCPTTIEDGPVHPHAEVGLMERARRWVQGVRETISDAF